MYPNILNYYIIKSENQKEFPTGNSELKHLLCNAVKLRTTLLKHFGKRAQDS